MMEVRDQMGYSIALRNYPQRIISLVPSLTELLFHLGLDEEIVGVTRYCILPEKKVASKIKIGGNTFIHEMLHLCGFINLFEKKSRYPQMYTLKKP